MDASTQKKFLKVHKKQNLNQLCTGNCSHSIYTVLGTVSTVEVIWHMIVCVCSLYANIPPFYIRDLSILGLWELQDWGGGSWNQSSKDTKEWLYSLPPPTSVQFSRSVVSDSATPWTAARQASLSITNPPSLLRLMSIELVMPSNHLILCHPLLLLPSIFPSIRVFSSESVLHIRWPKYWSFSFSISPCNEYLGLISFRIVWLDLLAVQGTLKSLLQHHTWKASILRRSALFIVQLSHPYMTTGKTIALTRWTFVGNVSAF